MTDSSENYRLEGRTPFLFSVDECKLMTHFVGS
jgi:hypothetical protein